MVRVSPCRGAIMRPDSHRVAKAKRRLRRIGDASPCGAHNGARRALRFISHNAGACWRALNKRVCATLPTRTAGPAHALLSRRVAPAEKGYSPVCVLRGRGRPERRASTGALIPSLCSLSRDAILRTLDLR
ncbi:hypothetical protein MRX96_025010 [Rhipicephalus microplus]